jgi:hypothetical protein
MSFSGDIKKFTAKTEDVAEKTIRGTALSIFSQIVLRTPVDTGRLRGNWQTDLNNVKQVEIERVDQSGSAAIREASEETGKYRLGDFITMSNNLPYAEPIENGSSDQAPTGMVKAVVLDFKRKVRDSLRKSKR